MDAQLRPITAAEIPAFVLADSYGFGERWSMGDDSQWALLDLDRTVAAFVDDEIVATGRNYTLELTVPGGAAVPAGGVSWISTRPTHRRRGLLRQVMTRLVEESLERGEVVSMLTASEGGIYPRFGYGVATRMVRLHVPKDGTEFLAPRSDLTLRLVEPDESVALARPLYEQVRPGRVGAVSRPDAWWGEEWFDSDHFDPKRRFDVVVEDGGDVVGHALYAIEGSWTDGFTRKVVFVRDLLAATDVAEAALWRYLLEIDQTTGVRAWSTPPDVVLPWLLRDARQVRTESVRDFLWVRPIDSAALLGARTYSASGSLVVEITDPSLDLDVTAGRFLLEGDTTGATCLRTDQAAELTMTADVLGAICLGGVRPSAVARSGRLTAVDASTLALADAMFRADREPYAFTWF